MKIWNPEDKSLLEYTSGNLSEMKKLCTKSDDIVSYLNLKDNNFGLIDEFEDKKNIINDKDFMKKLISELDGINTLSFFSLSKNSLYTSLVRELDTTNSCDEIVLIIAAKIAANRKPETNGWNKN